jgi:uncharacterized NAD(P)/FAD-binding protein YdhS
MRIDEDDITDYFWDWLRGETPINKAELKVDKKLRKVAKKGYFLLDFVLGHFKALEEEYNHVIAQIQEKNLEKEIKWDYHSGYIGLGREFTEMLTYNEPMYPEKDLPATPKQSSSAEGVKA